MANGDIKNSNILAAGSVVTTDATETELCRFSMTQDSMAGTYMIVTGCNLNGSVLQRGMWTVFTNDGGTITTHNSPGTGGDDNDAKIINPNDKTWSISGGTSGNDVIINVTGEAGVTIVWSAVVYGVITEVAITAA